MIMKRDYLLILVCVLLHPGIQAFRDCPMKCTCKERDTVVDCSNQMLGEVPTSLPPATVTLILRNNSISELDPTRLVVAPRLSYLDVSHNKLTNITEALQKSLPVLTVANFSNNDINNLDVITCRLWPSLENLDLSHNRIRFLKSGLFIPCRALQRLNLGWNQLGGKSLLAVRFISALQYLDLSGNRMPILISHAFVGLPNLQHLRVSHLGTRMLLTDTFEGLNTLQSLDLSYNDFYELDPAPFYKLKTLWVLNLVGIKFLCACGLKSLKTWVARTSVVLQGPVTCVVPKPSQTLDIRYTNMDQFCPPTTAPPTSALSTGAPSICDSAVPRSIWKTNITNSSAMLGWTTGGYRLPSSLTLRNIGGAVNLRATPIDLDANRYRFTRLQPDTEYVACVQISLCLYERCVLFRTLRKGNSGREPTAIVVTGEAPGSLSVAATVSVSVAVTIIIFLGCFVAYILYTKKLQILEKLHKDKYSPSGRFQNPPQTREQVPVQNGDHFRPSVEDDNMAAHDATIQVPSRVRSPGSGSLYNNPSYAEERAVDDVIWGTPQAPPPPTETNNHRPQAPLPMGYASISTEDITKPPPSVYQDLLPDDQQRILFKVGRSPGHGRRIPEVAKTSSSAQLAPFDSVDQTDVDINISDSENEGHYSHIKDCDIQGDPGSRSPNFGDSSPGGARSTNIEKNRESVLGGKSGTPHWKIFVPATMFEADNYENAARGETVESAGFHANVDSGL